MSRSTSLSHLAETLDGHLARVTRRRARRNLPAPQVLVTAPGFEYASGERALPFHAASVGKLATTALVMQEVSSGTLRLDAPVTSLLPAAETAGLFGAPGATLEHLLAHTSGVADYFEGRVMTGPSFIELVRTEPRRRWDAGQLLDFTRERQQPLAAPGRRFAYSDTGFVLLGRILEEHVGASFTALLRERILAPAGMDRSVLWLREPGPERIAPVWLGGTEVSGFPSLTCDWAGGGIVTTLDDLTALLRALRDGTLLPRAMWAAMTAPRHRFRPGIHYGLGAMQLRFEGFMPLLRGLPRCVGHLGVLGVHAFADPSSGATVVLNFHDTREMVPSFQSHIRIVQGLRRLRATPSPWQADAR